MIESNDAWREETRKKRTGITTKNRWRDTFLRCRSNRSNISTRSTLQANVLRRWCATRLHYLGKSTRHVISTSCSRWYTSSSVRSRWTASGRRSVRSIYHMTNSNSMKMLQRKRSRRSIRFEASHFSFTAPSNTVTSFFGRWWYISWTRLKIKRSRKSSRASATTFSSITSSSILRTRRQCSMKSPCPSRSQRRRQRIFWALKSPPPLRKS